jgi:hypothetical protein
MAASNVQQFTEAVCSSNDKCPTRHIGYHTLQQAQAQIAEWMKYIYIYIYIYPNCLPSVRFPLQDRTSVYVTMFFPSISLYWRPILWAKKGHQCRAVYSFFDSQFKHWEWKVRDVGRREGEVKCPSSCVTECCIQWSYRISWTVSCRPFSLRYWCCLVCDVYSDLV